MTNTKARVLGAVAGLALAGALLTGCGGSTQGGSATVVSKSDLQKQAKAELQAAAKKKARSVVCEGGIRATSGATQRCVLTATDGKKWPVTATVVAVRDGAASIDFKVGDQPVQ